jgi:tetratricopeptide (TPR) repeat protein
VVSMGKALILLLGLLGSFSSFAASDTPELGGGQVPLSEDEVIPGVSAPQIKGLRDDVSLVELSPEEQKAHMDKAAFDGAKELGVPFPFVQGVQQGMALLFLREYGNARAHFIALEERYPGTAVASVGQVLVWQGLMLENFDFKYDKQYQVALKAALKELKRVKKVSGSDGWEELLFAGMIGVDAIHSMRREKYIQALSRAFEAMEHISAAKEAAPNFPDLRLADGMYAYWRSIITLSIKGLPDYGDDRLSGIEHMEYVRDNGVFLAAPASLGLTYTWLEERRYKRAIKEGERNRAAYPDNIINNLVVARSYIKVKKYKRAIAILDHIQQVDSKNDRAHYYKAVALGREKRWDESVLSLQRYLKAPYLEPIHEAAAQYRLGRIYLNRKDYKAAESAFHRAVKLTKHAGAKKALNTIKDSKP